MTQLCEGSKTKLTVILLGKALRFIESRHLLRILRESVLESGIEVKGDNWKDIVIANFGEIINRPTLFQNDKRTHRNQPRGD